VDELTLHNYFGASSGYQSYFFEITYCSLAALALGYDDPNCEQDISVANQVMNESVSFIFSKAVVQYFNEDEFAASHTMNYTSQVVNYFQY
jgi:hypothetical protein